MVQETDRTGDERGGEGERVQPDELEPKAKKRKARPVPVQVVGREGVALLVQHLAKDGDLLRCIVPLEEYDTIKGTVDKEALDAGLPVGVQWEAIEGVNLAVAKELRRFGLFDAQDLLKQSHVVRKAVMRALVPPAVQALLDFARAEVTE